MRPTSLWRTTSWLVSVAKWTSSTPSRMSRTTRRPLVAPPGRSTCVTSPVTTILLPKPRRVRNIFICSAVVFCASSRMMNASFRVLCVTRKSLGHVERVLAPRPRCRRSPPRRPARCESIKRIGRPPPVRRSVAVLRAKPERLHALRAGGCRGRARRCGAARDARPCRPGARPSAGRVRHVDDATERADEERRRRRAAGPSTSCTGRGRCGRPAAPDRRRCRAGPAAQPAARRRC